MFAVVSDVKNYKHFVPFCKKSTVLLDKPDFQKAELEIGFPPFSEKYTSEVTLVKPVLVKAVCSDGKLFNHMVTIWRFSPGLKSNPLSCIIDFYIDFEFKSLLHSNVAHSFFDIIVYQLEEAFYVEAKRRFGYESLPGHRLSIKKS